MLYIPCVEFQFLSITSNYPLKKIATWDFQGGARLWQGPPPQKKEREGG